MMHVAQIYDLDLGCNAKYAKLVAQSCTKCVQESFFFLFFFPPNCINVECEPQLGAKNVFFSWEPIILSGTLTPKR